MNRPMLWAAAGIAAGILAGARTPLSYSLLLGGVLFALTWALSLRSLAWRDRLCILSLFFVCGAVLGWGQAKRVQLDPVATYARNHLASGVSMTVEGIVRAGYIYREGTLGRVVLDVDTVELPEGPTPMHGGVSVACYRPQGPIFAGERLRVRGRVDPTLSQVNFGFSSLEDYLRARGIHLAISTGYDKIERLGVSRWSPLYWVERLRQGEATLLARYVPPESLPFVLAVWLGENATVSPEEYDDFIVSGTAHVLSVSGVHVVIVYMTLNLVLSALVRHRKARAALVIVAVFLYSLLAGAHVATMRSAVMFALYLGAELFDREPDAPTTLGLAAFMFLVWSPAYLFDAGFLLSFISVASMLMFNEHIAARLPWRLGIARDGLAASVSPQLLSFPIAAQYFHVIPVYSVLANAVVVPLLSGVLWLCVLTTVAGALSTSAGLVFGNATHVLVLIVRWLVGAFATLPGSFALLSSPQWFVVPIFWIGAWFVWRALREESRPRAHWAKAAACAVVCALFWSPWRAPAEVDMLDVGHGDSMFVRTPGGTTMLIDGGDKTAHVDCGRRIVVPFLLSQGVRRLDYVVATHADSDHIGGLFEVLKRFRVGTVLLSAVGSDVPMERGFLKLCEQRGVPVRRMKRGDIADAGGAQIEALYPPDGAADIEKVNNRSLVLRASWPGLSVLCTGDIEHAAEQVLTETGECKATILKVPHHGSGTSSSEELLNAVSPTLALCSTDARPNRRPMDATVVARYARHAIDLRRTDYLGGLRLRERGGVWQIESARAARGYTLAPDTSPPPSITESGS